MLITYIPRVTQLDAVHLDEQVEELLKQQLFNAVKLLEPGVLQPVLPELELLLRSWIFKYSICDQRRTFGQQMLSLQYKTDNFSNSKLLWYYFYTILLKYVRDRGIYSFTRSEKVQNFIHNLEKFQLFADIINFLFFIQRGKHPIFIDLILGLELVAVKLTRENLSDFSWSRELLWHNFMELIGTTISLMNVIGLRQRMVNIVKCMWWRKYNTVTPASSSITAPTITSHTVCSCCAQKPVLPHTMGCSHIFCYYCLTANKMAEQDFACPKCNYRGAEIRKYLIT